MLTSLFWSIGLDLVGPAVIILGYGIFSGRKDRALLGDQRRCLRNVGLAVMWVGGAIFTTGHAVVVAAVCG